MKAVIFCDPIRQISPSRGFLGAVPCEVRTFLDSLSRDRPTSLRYKDDTLLHAQRQQRAILMVNITLPILFFSGSKPKSGVTRFFYPQNTEFFKNLYAEKFLYGKIEGSSKLRHQE